MSDHNILKTPGFKSVLNQYLGEISEGPTYICNICWKLKYRTNNVQHLVDEKYDKELFNKCKTGKSFWICKPCHKTMVRKKMPLQAQANKLSLNPRFKELDDLNRCSYLN